MNLLNCVVPSGEGVILDQFLDQVLNPIHLVPGFLFDQGAVLAGGSLMRAIVGKYDPQRHDLDLWVQEDRKSKKKVDYMKSLLQRGGWEIVNEQENVADQGSFYPPGFLATTYKRDGLSIDLLASEFPTGRPIERFDVNMSCIQYHPKTGLQWNQHFLDGATTKRVRPIQQYYNEDRTHSRSHKYIQLLEEYGFSFMESPEFEARWNADLD